MGQSKKSSWMPGREGKTGGGQAELVPGKQSPGNALDPLMGVGNEDSWLVLEGVPCHWRVLGTRNGVWLPLVAVVSGHSSCSLKQHTFTVVPLERLEHPNGSHWTEISGGTQFFLLQLQGRLLSDPDPPSMVRPSHGRCGPSGHRLSGPPSHRDFLPWKHRTLTASLKGEVQGEEGGEQKEEEVSG